MADEPLVEPPPESESEPEIEPESEQDPDPLAKSSTSTTTTSGRRLGKSFYLYYLSPSALQNFHDVRLFPEKPPDPDDSGEKKDADDAPLRRRRRRKSKKKADKWAPFYTSRLLLSAHSARLRALLSEADPANEDVVNVYTQIPSHQLKVVMDFLHTGCLPLGGRQPEPGRHSPWELLEPELLQAFQELGVDLERLDCSRVRLEDDDLFRKIDHHAAAPLDFRPVPVPVPVPASPEPVKRRRKRRAEEPLANGEAAPGRRSARQPIGGAGPDYKSMNDGPDVEDIKTEKEEEVELELDLGDVADEYLEEEPLDDDFADPDFVAEPEVAVKVKKEKPVVPKGAEGEEEGEEDMWGDKPKPKRRRKTPHKAPKAGEPRDLTLKYQCSHCNYGCNVRANMTRHEFNHTTSDKEKFVCLLCDQTFELLEELKQHTKDFHHNKKYDCPHCKQVYSGKQYKYFLQHVEQHGDLESNADFICIQCGKEFTDKRFFHAHTSKSHTGPFHDNKCYQCKNTEVRFKSWTEHKKHITEVHNDVYMIVCGRCPEVFKEQAEVTKHKRDNHSPKEKGYKMCEVCGKLESYNNLSKHMLDKHGTERLPCPLCKKILLSKQSLQYHMTLNHRPFPCDICGKKMRNKQVYKIHVANMHLPDDQKPFSCRFCPKGFGKKLAWQEHEWSHQNIRPYKCKHPGCEASFSANGNLSHHERAVHRGQKRPPRNRNRASAASAAATTAAGGVVIEQQPQLQQPQALPSQPPLPGGIISLKTEIM